MGDSVTEELFTELFTLKFEHYLVKNDLPRPSLTAWLQVALPGFTKLKKPFSEAFISQV